MVGKRDWEGRISAVDFRSECANFTEGISKRKV
jgi:hypothetical protein